MGVGKAGEKSHEEGEGKEGAELLEKNKLFQLSTQTQTNQYIMVCKNMQYLHVYIPLESKLSLF